MDAFDDEPKPDPAGDTKWRPKSGETRVSNPLELRMAPPWESGEQRGDYLIGELLGRGQAGFVYSAFDTVSRQRCALKVLCRLSPRDLYRNKLGFRRMTPFRHPCLLRTDRMESIDGRTVLRMEEIIGKTLFLSVKEDLTRVDRAEAYAQLKRLLHDYAYGLMTIHMSNLVHRDLKPTNLMVRAGGGGVIVDYGLVASCDPETDPSGIRPYIAGTPRYFSPEALWEQSYTPAGDVFSLGLVMLDCLHEISGGKVRLAEMRQGEFDNWVRNEDEEGISAAVSVLADEVPLDLRRAVTDMLSVDRTLRPTSHELVTMMRDADEGPVRLITNQSLYGRERELSDVLHWLNDIYREGSGRLHVHGESGTGKTRLLDEVERQLSQHHWVQLFRVKCQPWESRTLHVWDQIADQVAARYARHDRPAIRLDHVTMTTLQEAFPQLRHVIRKSKPAESLKDVLDPLAEAMRRLILELKKNGPLVFIIDDAQLADRPSNQLWDRLCDEGTERLGIITSSRTSDTQQNRAPDRRIELGALDADAAYAMLLHAAHRWSANINDAGLHELARYCHYNPFRLSELAEEFRPGGMLHVVESSRDASNSNLGDLDRLWSLRFGRLSKQAKSALVFIATADTAVSMEQLADLTGQSEEIGVSVSELVDQRLVNDDAIGDACLSVAHETIASGLIENLSLEEHREAHLAWAELLAKANLPRYAARIATHYYAAGDEASALRFAILAAENADRAFAKAEAARWHERVVEHVTGPAKLKHLRDAARCYQEACMPREASTLYLALADQATDAGEQIQYSTLALRLLLRCGEIDHARPLIQSLDRRLKFPRDFRLMELFRGYRARLYRLASELCLGDAPHRDEVAAGRELPPEDWNACRLQYCAAVTRPMVMLDFRSMLRSVMTGSELAAHHGSADDRIHFGVMAMVWSGVLAKHVRAMDKSLAILKTLRHRIEAKGSRRARAEVCAGIACIELLAMRWNAVPEGVNVAIEDYALDEQPLRFEVLHTRWMRMWASWHLGRWGSLRSDAEEMVEDATRQNDAYQRLLATSGYGGNAFLMLDRVEDSIRYAKENERVVTPGSGVEFADFFRWVHAVQVKLYRGRFRSAAVSALRMREAIDRSLIRRVDLIETIADFLLALVSLHVSQDGGEGLLERQISSRHFPRQAIRQLRAREGVFPKLLAELLQGIRWRLEGKLDSALKSFRQVESLASSAGLKPYEWAAKDAIAHLEGQPCGQLRNEMLGAGIRRPTALERLYTVAPPVGRAEQS